MGGIAWGALHGQGALYGVHYSSVMMLFADKTGQ